MTYIEKIKEFECALTPDFSLYMDMPRAMKIWNTYRSRLIGQMMQDNGIEVIPTINWAEKETYDFCFAGIPKGSIVSRSTLSCKKDEALKEMWCNGCDEMLRRLEPRAIVLYGGRIDGYDFGDTEVIEYDNHVTKQMRENYG